MTKLILFINFLFCCVIWKSEMRKLWRANMLHKGGVAALTIQTHLDQTFAQIGDFLTFDLAFTTYYTLKEIFYSFYWLIMSYTDSKITWCGQNGLIIWNWEIRHIIEEIFDHIPSRAGLKFTFDHTWEEFTHEPKPSKTRLGG